MAKQSGNNQSREARIARATELIRQHPSWGKDRVNATIKAEYGQGLQRIAVARLKRETLAPTLSIEDRRAQTMVRRGLFPSEARTLSQFPLSSPAISEYLRERGRLIRNSEKQGTSRGELNRQIRNLWKDEGYTKRGKTDYGKLFKDFATDYAKSERLKYDDAVHSPKAVKFTEDQFKLYRELQKFGFAKFEAKELALGDTSVQAAGSGKTWDEAMRARAGIIAQWRIQGLNDREILENIKDYYRKGIKRTPFDFIRQYDSYKAPKQLVGDEEHQRALNRQRRARSSGRRKADARIQHAFGRAA